MHHIEAPFRILNLPLVLVVACFTLQLSSSNTYHYACMIVATCSLLHVTNLILQAANMLYLLMRRNYVFFAQQGFVRMQLQVNVMVFHHSFYQ